MPADCEQTNTAAATSAGPYRVRPSAAPEVRGCLEGALSTTRRERRRAGCVQRWLTGLAACGYIAAAWVAGPRGGEEGGGLRIGWVPMAAGATYAIFRATRVGVRAHDLEEEVAALERLAEKVAGAPH